MNTYPKTDSSFKQDKDPPYDHGTLAYFQQRTRNNMYAYIVRRLLQMEEAGTLTRAELARRIKKSPAQVSHMLASPGNWTLATISDLLLGISDEELLPESVPVKRQTPRNFGSRDWLAGSNAIVLTETGSSSGRSVISEDGAPPASANKSNTLHLSW